MQNRGRYLEEPDAATAAAQLFRRGTRVSDCRCARCSRLQPPVVSAALAASGSPNRRLQSWRLLPLQQLRSCDSPPPLLLLLLLIVAICSLVGVAVSRIVRLGDGPIGGDGGSHCGSTVAKLEFGKVVREAVERFYEKALPALCGHVRQPPAAFLPFAGVNDEDECVLPMRGALRTAGLTSSHDSTTAFAVTTQGHLRVPISGYYYVFTQVGSQRLTARTDVINIMLEAVRGRSDKDEAATTYEEQRHSEPIAERRSDDELTLASVTPRISGNGAQIETPSIFSARVVRLHAGDELKLRLHCDRSGSGSGHRCGFESVAEAEACRRYHIGAHLIAPI